MVVSQVIVFRFAIEAPANLEKNENGPKLNFDYELYNNECKNGEQVDEISDEWYEKQIVWKCLEEHT